VSKRKFSPKALVEAVHEKYEYPDLSSAIDAYYAAISQPIPKPKRLSVPTGQQKRKNLKAFRRPKVSYGMGVHPKQRENAMKEARDKGVPTQYTPGGLPIIESVSHQKKLSKLYGFIPKRSYY
jgi:hypothetical protein